MIIKEPTVETATEFIKKMDETHGESWSEVTEEIAKAMVAYAKTLYSEKDMLV